MNDFINLLRILILAFSSLLILTVIYSILNAKKIDRFFNEYEALTGTVIKYSYTGMYFIEVKCCNNGINFLAKYEIPESEFRKLPIGSVAAINPSWNRYRYKIMEGDVKHVK